MELKLENIDKIRRLVDKAPTFCVEELRDNTIRDPKWIAFGTGNIFRAYISRIAQDLLQKGEFDRGINVIEAMDNELVKTHIILMII